jgi:hypothetical protein
MWFFDLYQTKIDQDQTMTEMFMFFNAFKKTGIGKSVRMAVLYSDGGEPPGDFIRISARRDEAKS